MSTGVLVAVVVASGAVLAQGEAWLSWSPAQAERIGRASYVRGRVGGLFDTRLLKTERSYNYKLAATWLTPDVVRATARLHQLRQRLSDAEATALVLAAESAAHTVVLVEIDPREGAGVVPLDWVAVMQFGGGAEIRGTVMAVLRDMPALAGVLRRNYDYDRFWVAFPLLDERGRSVVPDTGVATLKVRIHDKEGHVDWPLAPSVVARARQLEATASNTLP
jgi:hypothetical protein